MPADFTYPATYIPNIFMPITDASLAARNRRGDFLSVIGRLKPGVTIEHAHAEMNAIAEALEKQYPNSNTGWRINMVDLHERAVGSVRLALLALLSAVAFLLLIACANVSNLLLVRATARQKEIAIRTALGAGRGRLVRQLLTESLLLSLGGGLLGFGLAYLGVRGLIAISPSNTPRLNEVGIDRIVLGFTLLVTLITGLGFGIVPALQASSPNLNETLKDGRGSSQSSRSNRTRSILTVAEISLALVLLIGAGLMIKSFVQLQKVNPGFNTQNILTLDLALPRAKYPESNQLADFYTQVVERVRALPGVQSVGATSDIPIASGGNYNSFTVDGRPPLPPSANQDAESIVVSPNYFQTMGIRLLKGREFNSGDGPNSTFVTVISDTMASRYWPNEDPIGQRINFGGPKSYEIIGIISGVKMESLDTPAYPQAYAVYSQSPQRNMSLAIHFSGDALSLVSPIRGIVVSIDKDQPLNNVRTMEKVLVGSIAQQRLYMLLFGVFASIALLLAAVGIYGVMAYSVRQRTHEIGVRMALGARAGDVLKMVVGQGMVLAGIGIGIGLIAAFGLTHLMTSLLFGISASDPETFIAIPLLIGAVAAAACFIPARRATRIDPMKALRYE
jgi:putative ABC transport system permease protein